MTTDPPEDREQFNVVQFFTDGSYEYVRRCVGGEEAVKVFKRMTETVGARIGTTVKVIITDGGDCTNAMWEFGKGLVYPTKEELGR